MAASNLTVKLSMAWWFKRIYLPLLMASILCYVFWYGRKPDWVESSITIWSAKAFKATTVCRE